ncbi:MAG: citryl-CoA lyase [Candidatus Spechtbacterales bacterium]
MDFKTRISTTQNGEHRIYGMSVVDLIDKHSFGEVIFLILKGSFPNDNERQLLEAMLVAAIENGIEAPSIFVPRTVASTGGTTSAALAAGVLTIGENHGGAVEAAARLLASQEDATAMVAAQKIIPGYGHKIYKDEDPRATALREKAKELGFLGAAFERAYAIEVALKEKTGKHLPLNIDGAMAACMLELGLDASLGKSLFIIARVVGMAAHVAEEQAQENSYHRLSEDDVTYEG